MDASRTKPQIGEPKTPPVQRNEESGSYLWGILTIIFLCIFIPAIFRVNSGSGSKLDQIICYGPIAFFVVMAILAFILDIPEAKARRKAKEAWKISCKVAEVSIVERSDSGGWDDGYRIHNFNAHLNLEMTPGQRAVSSGSGIVRVEVNDSVYKRLSTRNTVRIFYEPEAPLTFLLEEEL